MSKNIKELRNQTGLNRKEFSEEFKIPYMTLTDWELKKHEPPEYVHRLLEYYVHLRYSNNTCAPFNNEECMFNNMQDTYRSTFPILLTHTVVPVKYIHPLHQEDAINIHEIMKKDIRINSIVLFGNSVSIHCQNDSDLELAINLTHDYENIETKINISEMIQKSCNNNVDITWINRFNTDEKLYANILKGVQIV